MDNKKNRPLVLCNNVDDIKAQVNKAIYFNKIIRVAGSQHSAADAIFAKPQQPNICIKLEGSLRKVTVLEKHEEYIIVKVGAGCNLGIDPSDNMSSAENSFNRIINKEGYAFSILGGMSHQTIGGYMMTSTAGGSIPFGFADALEEFEFVDGNGELQTVSRGTDDFNAAAVSMGLFGIITHVKLKLQKNYLVQGVEGIYSKNNSVIKDADTFKKLLQETQYIHCVWSPAVDRVLQFKGNQVPYKENINPEDKYQHDIQYKTSNMVAAAILLCVNMLYGTHTHTHTQLYINIANLMLMLFNRIYERKFCDYWYVALPNDDKIYIDTVLKVQFTEIWIDIEHTKDVMEALKELFQTEPLAAGNLGVELYGAKKSPFWMSQSYERDVIRIDPYWWEYNIAGNMQEFFTKYWNVLLNIPTARLHWGKHFPEVGTKFDNFTIGPDYVTKSYPKFNEWMEFRKKYDPKQIFVTDYWRKLLGIPKLTHAPTHAPTLPQRRKFLQCNIHTRNRIIFLHLFILPHIISMVKLLVSCMQQKEIV
jgi:D-arabinono-1,4-lactone oxidase